MTAHSRPATGARATHRDDSLVPATERSRFLATIGVLLLVVTSVVSWRRGALYQGGTDPVVIAKAVVALIAAAGAVLLWRTASARRALAPVPAALVAAIVAISLVGAALAGALVPNLVLAVRIALLGGTVLLVLAVTPTGRFVAALLAAAAGIGLLAATTGAVVLLTTPGAKSRLAGGIPQIAPNELATLVLPAAIGLACLLVRRPRRPLVALALLMLTGIIVWTGSRTALAVLVLGALLALVLVRRLRRRTVLIGAGVVIALLAASVVTGLLGRLLLRGEGIDRLLTLNSRLIAWQAVLATPKTSWAWWIGRGLSVKTTPVVGQYWKDQVFDSSWFSSLAQDGLVGTVLLAVLVVGMVVAVSLDRRMRAWALPLAVTLVIRSFVENGLIESSLDFVLLLTLATTAWAGTPDQLGRRWKKRLDVTAPVPARTL